MYYYYVKSIVDLYAFVSYRRSMEYDKYSKFSDDTDGEPFQNSSIQRFSSVTSKLQSDSSYDITGSYVVNNLHNISA